jgi:hypothetical protein
MVIQDGGNCADLFGWTQCGENIWCKIGVGSSVQKTKWTAMNLTNMMMSTKRTIRRAIISGFFSCFLIAVHRKGGHLHFIFVRSAGIGVVI